MGDRSSRKRVFLPILVLAGFALLQALGRTQDTTGRSRSLPLPDPAAGLSDSRDKEADIGRLGQRLRQCRSTGDFERAGRIFERLFPAEAADDPAIAVKTATASPSNRVEGAPEYGKGISGSEGTSPVFYSIEHEKNPSADIGRSGDLFSAAEQWAGDRPRDIRIRKSSDGGLTWPDTIVIGDGRPWTRPSLRKVSDDTVGMAFVKDWDGGEGDIYFARVTGDLAMDSEFPVALSMADQRSPSVATDWPAYAAPYVYIVYAERDGQAGSVKFRVSQDRGASWSRAVTIGAFSGAKEADIDTAITFDPDERALHVAYTRPQGPSTGIAVATSVDFGASWSRPAFVTPADDKSDASPRIAAKGGTVIIAYEHEAAATGRDIGLAFSSASGSGWTTGGSLAGSAAAETSPDVRASEGAGRPAFFASYVEENARVLVLSCEASAPGSWTTEGSCQADAGSLALGPVVVLPMEGPDENGSAGAIWASRITDFDVYFGSVMVPLSLATLEVTPANQEVPYTAGTTSFAVVKRGSGVVHWTAAVTSGQAWLAITSGSAGTNAGTIIAAYQENPTSTPRVGSIRVTPVDVTIPSVTVAVTQAVSGPPGALSVTPTGGFASSGLTGGPFSPLSQAYTLRNTGETSIVWTAGKTQTWVTLSTLSGTLAAGATATVTVSINAGANALAAGTYSDTVTFANVTNGSGNTTRAVSLTITGAGALSVDPAGGLTSSGLVGGPFTPSSKDYILQNTGGRQIAWTATATQTWVTVSPPSGDLAAGASATVTVSINTWADALAAGTHNDVVTFANASGGAGSTTRGVSLTIGTSPVLAVSPSSREVTFPAGATTFGVSNTGGGTMSWTASVVAGGDWLSITAGASGTDAGTITAAFAINRTAVPRVGIIRVIAVGAAGSPKDVVVSQAQGSIGLDLVAERLVEKAWILQREYGRLTVAVANPASAPVDRYIIYRRSGILDYQVLAEVAGSSVAGSLWTYYDTFVEAATSYSYRVVALDALGNVIGESNAAAI